MIDCLLQVGANNLLVSLALALVAWTVQILGRRPLLAHLLWLLVLAKLLTPPLVTVPMVALPGLASGTLTVPADRGAPAPAGAAGVEAAPTDRHPSLPFSTIPMIPTASPAVETWKLGLVLLWLSGSVSLLCWSLLRIRRFDRLLRMASTPAPVQLRDLARELATRLGLVRMPELLTTNAQLSPMVWGYGRSVRVVIPDALVQALGGQSLRLILAHELAHVRRRDHLVRWLEWLACVAFWWNPVAWAARRNLRLHEEVCCDALVLSTLAPQPHSYADSLLRAVEFLATPALRPPVLASGIDGGGFLARRFDMILSNPSLRATPRWLQGLVLMCAVGLLPLGVAYAQSPDFKSVAARLEAAIQAGEISPAQAKAMMAALKQTAGAETDAVTRRLEQAVKAGELSPAQAKAMLGALARQKAADGGREAGHDRGGAPGRDARRDSGELYRQAAAKIKQAVAEGHLSKEEARAKLEAVRKKLDAEAGRDRGADRPRRDTGRRTDRPRRDTDRAGPDTGTRSGGIDWEAVKRKLGAAVEAGKLSREEAAAKLEALRRDAAKKDGTARDR